MKSTLQRISDIKRNGYKLDLGETINATFANYQKIALLGGAVTLLVVIAAVVILGGLATIIFGIATATQTFTEYSQGMLSGTGFAINLVSSIVAAGLFAPIAAGFVQMAHNASVKKDFDFGTAFMHYKSVHFKELFLAAAIVTLLGSGLSTLFQVLNVHNPDSILINIAVILSGIISLLAQIFTFLIIPLIIFGNLSAMDAIKGSITLVSKNFWTIFLLLIVCGFFIMLGLFAICIGILFTLPALYSLQYITYKAALPIDENNELEEIGKDFY
ncbi:hypothetical protein [Flavobacterium tegetincola]|uniref:hypothetical protein n=1 Tax=Flavobacterium tegetincola TaxID=150172 RepID=UPI00041030AF|nr:hypothetical protein [Flavobacterium tegetincola]